MITLSFLKLLEDNGFGTIDEDLFFQKLALDNKGLSINDIGDPVSRGTRWTQSFELLSKGNNDVEGYKKLSDVLTFLKESYSNVCTLPEVPPHIEQEYTKVTIRPLSTITNVGYASDGRILYSIQGQITYKQGEQT